MKQKKYTYDFQQCETIRSFGEIICIPKASIVEAEEDTSRPKTKGKYKKETLMKVHVLFIKVEN